MKLQSRILAINAFLKLFIVALLFSQFRSKDKFAIVNGSFSFLKNGDTVEAICFENGPYLQDISKESILCTYENNRFSFLIPIRKDYNFIVIHTNHPEKRNIQLNYLSDGDNINIDEKYGSVSFYGKGAEKANIYQKMSYWDSTYCSKFIFSKNKIITLFLKEDSVRN